LLGLASPALALHKEKLKKIQAQMQILMELQAEKAKREAAATAVLDAEIASLPSLPSACFWPGLGNILAVTNLYYYGVHYVN
jgi:hypothetical protein